MVGAHLILDDMLLEVVEHTCCVVSHPLAFWVSETTVLRTWQPSELYTSVSPFARVKFLLFLICNSRVLPSPSEIKFMNIASDLLYMRIPFSF